MVKSLRRLFPTQYYLLFFSLLLLLLQLSTPAWLLSAYGSEKSGSLSKLIEFKDVSLIIVRVNQSVSGVIFNASKALADGSITVMAAPINSTHYLARVVIQGNTARLEALEGTTRLTGIAASLENVLESVLRELENSMWVIEGEATSITVDYVVDVRSNYAWVNGSFAGFFPFYIFPAIGYDNATSFDFVHMGAPLRVDIEEEAGQPIPVRYDLKHVYRSVSNRLGVDYLPCLLLKNRYLRIIFVYHYPIEVSGWFPLNETTYIYLETARVDDSYMPIIISIDDYPSGVSYVDYRRLFLFLITVAGVAGLGVYLWKRRKR